MGKVDLVGVEGPADTADRLDAMWQGRCIFLGGRPVGIEDRLIQRNGEGGERYLAAIAWGVLGRRGDGSDREP